jgi:electron transfer flavoprotein beta subunit
VCAGFGASSALREAAVFGASRLIALADEALEGADEAGIAAALAGAINHLGGVDVVFCGASTASYGSGAVPGLLSARLNSGLYVDVLGTEMIDDRLSITVLGADALWNIRPTLPAIVAAASYGIKVRAMSPLLLIKASKKTIESLTLADIGCDVPLPSTGAADGAIESARTKKSMETIEAPDASTRAITLVAALRDKRAV